MKIAWITDSTSSLSLSEAEKLNITVFSTEVIFGQNTFLDGVNLSPQEFYNKLNNTKELPTTSQPSIGLMTEKYKELKEDYDIGIAVHVSSALSGTLSSSKTAAEMAGFPLLTIDSKGAGPILISLIEKGRELIEKGIDIDETVRILNQYSDRVRGLILVGSLEQLHRGGRVSGAGLVIGNLLQVKPILELKNGSLVPKEKVRTLKKAEKRVLELFNESRRSVHEPVHIVHSEEESKSMEWASVIDGDTSICVLSPSIGVHVGSGTIGIIWFENKEK